MITPATATVVISLAKGAIKLGNRLDVLLAEKTAVEGTFVLPMPAIADAPSGVLQVRELRAYLAAHATAAPRDPLGDLRVRLVRTLKENEPDAELVGLCFQRVFPQRMKAPAVEPDSLYIAELRKVLPALDISDGDALAAAFHVAAGRDSRGLNYGMRVGLLVADVIAEFGAENTALFVRDPQLRQAAQAVLERFAEPDLETFPAWGGLVRHALSSTLNGLLDARSKLGVDAAWVSALLDVLAEARDDAHGDEFVIGLFQGRGYSRLLSEGLTRAAAELAVDQTSAFKQMAAAIIGTAAPLTRDQSFGTFFNDHWTDLLRGGLLALEKQTPVLLKDKPELVRDVSIALVRALAATPQARLLSTQTLVHLTDAAVGAVAAKPALLTQVAGGKPWLEVLLGSVVSTVSRDGVRQALEGKGVATIVDDVAGLLATHPELLIKNPELIREVVGPVLNAVQTLRSLDAHNLAQAAAMGALTAMVARHGLSDTRFAPLTIEFTGRVAELVQSETIRGIDAPELINVAIATLLNNPRVLELHGNLAASVLFAVQTAAAADPRGLLSGPMLVATIQEVLAATARYGRLKAEASLAKLTTELTQVIRSSLSSAADQLGRNLALSGVPLVIGGMVAAWARGEIVAIDPADLIFRTAFERLAAAT